MEGTVMAKFTVDTQLFRELGELLVGRESTALVELIKNSYDADSSVVAVFGSDLDDPANGGIVITDNGVGMIRRGVRERIPAHRHTYEDGRYEAVIGLRAPLHWRKRDRPTRSSQACATRSNQVIQMERQSPDGDAPAVLQARRGSDN